MKNTQLKIVKDQLLSYGEVSRNWCLARKLTRLASRINDLKKEGWVFFPGFKREGDYVYKVADIPAWDKSNHIADQVAKSSHDQADEAAYKLCGEFIQPLESIGLSTKSMFT